MNIDRCDWLQMFNSRQANKDLGSFSVVVFGAGSVGSWIADDLCRAGIQKLTVLDDDIVCVENLCRTNYLSRHVGVKKVDAQEVILKNINPYLEFKGFDMDVRELSDADFLSLSKHDLAIVSVDTLSAVRLISYHLHSKIPTVFAGVFPGAYGGDVYSSVPGAPCWECVIGKYSEQPGFSPDYGRSDGRSNSMMGLGADIRNVSVKASLIAIDILKGAFSTKKNYLLVGNRPDGEHVKEAFQNIWATSESDKECVICGSKGLKDIPPKSCSSKVLERYPSELSIDKQIDGMGYVR